MEYCKEERARGMKWLDEVEPQWRRKVSKTLLQMGHIHYCLLAQVFGSYTSGWSLLPSFIGKEGVFLRRQQREMYYGFKPSKNGEYDVNGWDLLTEAWKEEL